MLHHRFSAILVVNHSKFQGRSTFLTGLQYQYTGYSYNLACEVSAQCPLRFASPFDKDVHAHLPSSITLSTRFFAKPCKANQGFMCEPTSTKPTNVASANIRLKDTGNFRHGFASMTLLILHMYSSFPRRPV